MGIESRSGLRAALLCVRTVLLVSAVSVAAAQGAAAQTASTQVAAPDSPAPQAGAAAQLQPMPAPDPANFTAATPTKDTVNAFLKQSWGYDANRVWQVQAIQTTPVQGISRVTILVEERGTQQQQPSALVFLTLPDTKHLIANDEILPFGARPFDAAREILRRDAKGPSRGPATAPLWLVEFADFECPHCKEAQPTVERLLKDFPQARYVAQPFPLRSIHSEAEKAAEGGVCVAKLAGNDGYFKYSDAIYANQASLTPEGSKQAIAAAATAAGVAPAKIESCMSEPATKAAVDASVQLGEELGVNQTPTLYVNGRNLPFAGIPYDSLKQIIQYQLQIDADAK